MIDDFEGSVLRCQAYLNVDSLDENEVEGGGSVLPLDMAFGHLRRLQKEMPAAPIEPPEWKWTAPFRFLHLPREIRDRVYFFCLYAPESFLYKRSGNTEWTDRNKRLWKDSGRTPLFFTSRQVFEEAMEAFCRYNVVQIHRRRKTVGAIRLFPAKPAQKLQRIQLTYSGNLTKRDGELGWEGAHRTFPHMIMDAKVVKEYFPTLREFIAAWLVNAYDFQYEENMRLGAMNHGEKEEAFLRWFHFWHAVDNLVPPKCLKVEFKTYYDGDDGSDLQRPFGKALERFRREVRGQETSEEDLELSGKKWLEEAWVERTGKKKDKKGKQALKVSSLCLT